MNFDLSVYKNKLTLKRSAKNELLIYARLRKKWLICTPEEICRQCLIYFLAEQWNLPLPLMKEECVVTINQRRLRIDILVYDKEGHPFFLVEVKAPYVDISMETYIQATQYAQHVKTKYLFLTNGISWMLGRLDPTNQHFTLLEVLPQQL